MISGCNNVTCPLKQSCIRGRKKLELGDAYILGEYKDGKCDDYITY